MSDKTPPRRPVSGALPALLLGLVGAGGGAGGAAAGPPSFESPVDCPRDVQCFVQNYVDVDPGPNRHDFTCGMLTYDGHTGTDIRVPDRAVMRRGVAVLAAAAGTVARVRDGMDDVGVGDAPGGPDIAGREAGNAVVIDHGDGWETQYSHLRRGSVAVRPGDRVAAGQPVGQIGLSGNTVFPHVDFVVRHQGRVLDPFLGVRPPERCGVQPRPLWTAAAAAALAYRPTGLVAAGFALETPQDAKVRDGAYADTVLTPDSPVLAFWAEVFGGQPEDRLRLRIAAPDGRLLFDSQAAVPKPLAVLIVSGVAARPPQGWPAGTYRGTLTLLRGARPLVEQERRIALR